MIDLLIQCSTEEEVRARFNAFTWAERIESMGPKGWESLCLGYLIQVHGFLPTGLIVGGTLADFDIVGRAKSGEVIYAQCKKSPGTYPMDEDDEQAFRDLPDALKYFFAFRSTNRTLPGVRHINGDELTDWLENDPSGREYKNLLER